jgi:hypothetical protein
MTPESIPTPSSSGTPLKAMRPPDFLLPKTENHSGRRRGGRPDIYVSWDGQIYGPAAVDEVINGVRTGYFEEDALFWFEGRTAWRPVEELPELFETSDSGLAAQRPPRTPPAEAIRPKWPGKRTRSSSSSGGAKRRRNRKGRSGKSSRSTLGGRLVVIGAVLLAVLITAGLLLLISRA